MNLSFIRILKSEDVLLSTKFPIYLLIMEFLVKQKPLFFMKLIHPLQFAVDCTIRAGKVARCEQHRGGWQNCRARVESAIANLVRGAWMGDRFLSRRDSTIVARHEVPGYRWREASSRRDGRSHCQSQRYLSSKLSACRFRNARYYVLITERLSKPRSVQSSRWDGLFYS